MATEMCPDGITVIEVDRTGRIINTTTGFGQGWKAPRAPEDDCGSPEWLSEIVVASTPHRLAEIMEQVTGDQVFDGSTDPGTSITTCKSAVYLLPEGRIERRGEDYQYSYVLAEGTWRNKEGKVLHGPAAGAVYRASSLIVAKSPIEKIPALKERWDSSREQSHLHAKLTAASLKP